MERFSSKRTTRPALAAGALALAGALGACTGIGWPTGEPSAWECSQVREATEAGEVRDYLGSSITGSGTGVWLLHERQLAIPSANEDECWTLVAD